MNERNDRLAKLGTEAEREDALAKSKQADIEEDMLAKKWARTRKRARVKIDAQDGSDKPVRG